MTALADRIKAASEQEYEQYRLGLATTASGLPKPSEENRHAEF